MVKKKTASKKTKQPTEQKPNWEPSLRTLAMPADTNPNGDIFGGWLLSQMDMAGANHAYHAAHGRIVTVGIEAMSFHLPVFVGDLVSCYCDTKRTGTTSISVHVQTWVQRRDQDLQVKVTEGLFTFVAINTKGKPRSIVASKKKASKKQSRSK